MKETFKKSRKEYTKIKINIYKTQENVPKTTGSDRTAQEVRPELEELNHDTAQRGPEMAKLMLVTKRFAYLAETQIYVS